MRPYRLYQVAGAAIMQEKHPLSETPQGGRAELIGAGRTLGDPVCKTCAHVMHEQV